MRGRAALVIVYSIAALWLGGRYLIRALPARVVAPLNEFGGDGVVDWHAARAFRDGWNPYSEDGLKRAHIEMYGLGHPPTTAFWFLPFTELDPTGLHQVTGQIVLLLLALHLFVLAVELRAPVPLATVILAFGFVVSRRWMEWHLAMVQLGEPIAFLYLVSWLFLRRDRQWEGGAALGLAATLKLFPGLMLVFLALTRRWKALASAVLAWGVIAAIMTWRFDGPICWLQFFRRQAPIADTWMAHLRNASLSGIVLRWWWPACKDRGPVLWQAQLLSTVLALAILAACWWVSRKKAACAESVDVPFALFSVLSVFLNPWVWEHYYVLLITPMAIAAAELRRVKGWWLGAAAVAAVLRLVAIDPERKSSFDALVAGEHWRLHLYEIFNWLPWVIALALLGALSLSERRRPGV